MAITKAEVEADTEKMQKALEALKDVLVEHDLNLMETNIVILALANELYEQLVLERGGEEE